MIAHWRSEERVALQVAIGAELLEIELVPKSPRHVGTDFPEKERADDAIAARETDARFEAAVNVTLGLIKLGAAHGVSRRRHQENRRNKKTEPPTSFFSSAGRLSANGRVL